MKIHLLPALQDNYFFVGERNGSAFVVDPGEASTVLDFLKTSGLRLENILVTHHHHDHIGGVAEIAEAHPHAQILGPSPARTDFTAKHVLPGDLLNVCGSTAHVIHLPGHTLNHLAYSFENERAVFVGDVLFGLGCGRLFEGTFEQGFESLQILKRLSPQTAVYCAHEYTVANLRFCESQGLTPPGWSEHASHIHQLRAANRPTVPLSLEAELRFNPFLTAPDAATFHKRRQSRNEFRG